MTFHVSSGVFNKRKELAGIEEKIPYMFRLPYAAEMDLGETFSIILPITFYRNIRGPEHRESRSSMSHDHRAQIRPHSSRAFLALLPSQNLPAEKTHGGKICKHCGKPLR